MKSFVEGQFMIICRFPAVVSTLISTVLLASASETRAGVTYRSAEIAASSSGNITDNTWSLADRVGDEPPDSTTRILLVGGTQGARGYGLSSFDLAFELFEDSIDFYLVGLLAVVPSEPVVDAAGLFRSEWELRFSLDEPRSFEFGVESLLEFRREPPSPIGPPDLKALAEDFTLLDSSAGPVFDVERESAERELHFRRGVLQAGEYTFQIRNESAFAMRSAITSAGLTSNFGGSLRFLPVPEPASISLAVLVWPLAIWVRDCVAAAPHG
jgi:hypothetical protein